MWAARMNSQQCDSLPMAHVRLGLVMEGVETYKLPPPNNTLTIYMLLAVAGGRGDIIFCGVAIGEAPLLL